MPKILVDGVAYEAKAGDNLLQALLQLGLDLPYFCWHPALGSAGACRQCAVLQYRDENDQRGRLAMACMTPVADGLRIGLQAPAAKEFRAGVVELLMTNHPHDCPVCEEGGECHLQDMTLMTGHTERRYRGTKRTHRNQNLGPFVNHEMNRCIACYRCVRYYRDYAGGHDLDVFASRNNVYFGRCEDGVLESPFSGNLVEVCPTGVFTDKTFSAHYSRKWDLQTAPSVCVHCGVGCNTSPGERYGTLRRIVDRYHGAVNGYFLCDRGRFGYGFVDGDTRIRSPLLLGQPVDRRQAAAHFAAILQRPAIGIGSPRASVEANFALRELVGAENFYAGISDAEYAMLQTMVELARQGPVHLASLREMERADAVLVLGEDATHTAPRMALALRQTLRNRAAVGAAGLGIAPWQDAAVRKAGQGQQSPLFVATPAATPLDDVAQSALRLAPADIARLGYAIAHALDDSAPAADWSAEELQWTAAIAAALRTAEKPLLVCGTGCGDPAIVQATANIAKALAGLKRRPIDLGFAVLECNSLGLALLGARPLGEAFDSAGKGQAKTALVLENDLYRRAEAGAVDRFLAAFQHLAVIDHTSHATAAKAELVLPAATFAETVGTLVSSEGRAQRFFAVLPPQGEVRDAWRWLAEAAQQPWQHIDTVTQACAQAFPSLAAIVDAAPGNHWRSHGLRVPRQPHRYSGRTAMTADVHIHEPRPAEDADSALAYSMEGTQLDVPPALRPYAWAPGWNSNQQAANKFQEEIGGELRGGDPGVRLIEPQSGAEFSWFTEIPPAFRQEGSWLVIPLHHIFGSEELSVLSGPVAERVPAPYIALHPDDAASLARSQAPAWERTPGSSSFPEDRKLELPKPGYPSRSLGTGATRSMRDQVEVEWDGGSFRLPLRLDASLPRGTAGIPAGLPGMPFVPGAIRVRLLACGDLP